MTSRTLRPYQRNVINEICNCDEHLLIQQPTGSGKTLILGAASVSMLDSSITHAIIACPQVQIERGFVGLAGRVDTGSGLVDFSGDKICTLPKRAKAGAVLSYINSNAPGYVIATTHQTLGSLSSGSLPDELHGKVLFVDEAHHAAENVTRLGDLVRAWHQRGGRVIYATATDFRTDSAPVTIPGMRTVRRSLAEHMQDPDGPYAPERIESEIVSVDLADRKPTAKEVHGNELFDERHQRLLIEHMVHKWLADDKPKTIIKIPIINAGTRCIVKGLVAAFQKAGARVQDATGTTSADQRRFHSFLEQQREEGKRFDDAHDVVIGIQRVIEGTDWPWCSDVFVVGMPSSLQQIIQLLGRATRLKSSSYPEAFRDRARIVFFVPTGGGSALSSLNLDHSRKILLLTAFLADTETGEKWLLEDGIARGYLASLGDRDPSEKDKSQKILSKIQNTLDAMLDPQDAAIAKLIILDIVKSAPASGSELTVDEIRRRVTSHKLVAAIPDDRRDNVLHRVIIQCLLVTDENGGRVSQRLQQRTTKVFATHNPTHSSHIHKELTRIFKKILDEFRDATISESGSLQALGRQLHRLSGKDIQAFTERLSDGFRIAYGVPIQLADLHAEIWNFYRQHGNWPSVYSGFVEQFNTEFHYLDHCLRKGQRGLGPNSSLYTECKRVAADKGKSIEKRTGDMTPWTLQTVQDEIRGHFQRCGKFPLVATPGTTSLGTTWSTINFYLRRGGHHGLPGGSTLAQQVEAVKQSLGMLQEHAAELTFENIRRAILLYQETHGQYPRRGSSDPVPIIGGAWGTLNNRLRKGKVSEVSSLATIVKFIRTQKNDPPAPAKRPLTVSEIHLTIRRHIEQYGEAPSRQSGGQSVFGISWGHLDNLLKKGGRGLPGGSSLASEKRKLLAQVEEAVL
ncbi:DEAD/DEAH box helicase [Symmachiella dynata]|uniref:DEAD/DEAH box helicase n=1 Tax=Symmachiella dynata TaxID=2527995 RepID=UPI0030EF16B4